MVVEKAFSNLLTLDLEYNNFNIFAEFQTLF